MQTCCIEAKRKIYDQADSAIIRQNRKAQHHTNHDDHDDHGEKPN